MEIGEEGIGGEGSRGRKYEMDRKDEEWRGEDC